MSGLVFRDRTEEEDQANARQPSASGGTSGIFLPGTLGLVQVPTSQDVQDQVTNYRYGRFRDNLVARRLASEEIYDQADDEIFRITGQRLGNPVREDFYDPLSASGTGVIDTRDPIARWHSALAEMAARDARLAELFARYQTRASVEAMAQQLRQDVTDEYHDYLGDGGAGEQLWRGILGAPGMIAGALSSGSPEQVAQLAAGGGGRGLSLTERAVRGALANVIGQAAVEPAIIEDARRMGEEYPVSQVWLDFMIAAGLGATIDVGGGVIERANRPAIERTTETPLRETVTNVTTVTDRDRDAPGETVQQALAGQAESLVVSSYSRDAATARTLPDPDGLSLEALADDINANDDFIEGRADSPVASRQTPLADPEAVAAARRAADDAPTPDAGARDMVRMGGVDRPRTFERISAASLRFDPATFQYKRSEGAQGSTGRLAGVEAWDGQSSGKIIVFEAADGTRYVADGHQRTALAQAISQRDGQDILLDGFVYREADGWTPREVRNLAAQKNLRETPGDPIDTATLIREAPELIDSSVPQRSAEFRTARGIAQLSEPAFRAVRAGQIEPRLGAVIGEVAAGRPEIHEALVTMFQQQPPRTIREATFITHEAMQAELFKDGAAQLSMFGDAPELAGMRERAEILRITANQLRSDRRLFAVAERNADTLEAAGNVIAKEENARRADLADALVRHLDVLATRPSPVSRLLREIAERAAIAKIKPDVAATQFTNGLIDLLQQHGLVGLMQERAPDVPPPAPINAPPTPRLEEQARAAKLNGAHDADAEARQQALAEVAVMRALAGDMADMPDMDAIGHTPAADLARIEAALDALGVDDPTVAEVAAALYARATPDMEAEARARATGEPGEQPATRAEVVEQNADVETWNPYEFEDLKKLEDAVWSATLPQLEKIQRTFGAYGDGEGSRTRAEFLAAFKQEWRDANGEAPPPPTAPLKRPPPSPTETRDLIKRAARFANRDDAAFRYQDALGDLVDAIDRMKDGDAWLRRAIEDEADNRRVTVLRHAQQARQPRGQFAREPGDVAAAAFRDIDPDYVNEAWSTFDDFWGKFSKAFETLTRETNDLPVGVREPVEQINAIMSANIAPSMHASALAIRGEWRAAFAEIVRLDPKWFGENWLAHKNLADPTDDQIMNVAMETFDGMFVGDKPTEAWNGMSNSALWYEDMRALIEAVAFNDTEYLDGFADVPDALALRASKVLDELPEAGEPVDAYEVMNAVLPHVAKLRRNLDELWDEWQGTLGTESDQTNREALKVADGALADAMAVFDGNAETGEQGLRSYSRPRNVRFATRGSAPAAPVSTVADWTRAAQREFPRWGKKLLERARLQIVQSVDELPDSGRGFYARLFEGVSKPEQRIKIADAFEHVRTSEIVGTFSDFYAWRSSDGRPMAVEIASGDPRNAAIVSFGELYPGGLRFLNTDTHGMANALETIGNAMAVLDRDARDFRRPGYRFAGLTDVHKRVYQRMFSVIDPPDGYIKIEAINDSGTHAAIAVVRNDVAERLGLQAGRAYKQTELMELSAQRTRLPRSEPMENKQRELSIKFNDELEALMNKAHHVPRPGAFARGNGTIGYSEGGQSWIVADNAPVEMARGLILHEVGEHVGMPEMLGEEGYAQFLSEVERLHTEGDADIQRGYAAAVKAGTPDSQLWSETVAYALMYADEGTMSTGFRGLMMRIINSVRAWFLRYAPSLVDTSKLTFEDMQFLALGALRHAASNDPRVIDTRSMPTRIREALMPKPRTLAADVADAGGGWLRTRVFHGKSGNAQQGMVFMTPKAKIAGLYGEIEAFEVRGPIHDASDLVIRTQDEFRQAVKAAKDAGANGVYIQALDRGELGAQEQIVMFRGDAIRPAGSGRIDPNNPASVAEADAARNERVVEMLEHCK